MAVNKLHSFILFNLFKLPAVLVLIGVLCLISAGVLFQQATQINNLVTERNNLDTQTLANLAHIILQTNWTALDVVKASKVPVQVLQTNPVQIETTIGDFKRLEQLGLSLQEITWNGNKATITLKPYPPTL